MFYAYKENNLICGSDKKETVIKICKNLNIIDYELTEYEKIIPKEKSLDELKAEKLEALTAYAGQFDQYKCDDMYVTSSIGGYKFNADIRSQTNMQGLIDVLDEGTTTLYKDYDNEFRTMTKADLVVLKSECLQNGQYLYQQKWTLQTKINACNSKEELDAIEIKFEMLEFNHAD